jgi:hypothetical protein
VIVANLAAAFFLTGLSWFLQIVQFPILEQIDGPEFSKIAALHRRRNTLLMAGPMTFEMIVAILFGWRAPAFALLIAIWLITFLRHVPLHRRLLAGYDASILRQLARWNWIRTLCWTARAGLLVLIALGVFGGRR